MMRLDKILAQSGWGSRQQVKAIIREGRVTVDERRMTDPGMHAEPDHVQVDGQPVNHQAYVYLMLNKPEGVLTATRDNHTPTVLDLLPEALRRRQLAPVGRLDKDAQGLLIITDDGALTHFLLSPARHVDKVYEVICDLPFDETDIPAFAQGLELSDFIAKPAGLSLLNPPTHARITVTEGKFHQVKRMCAARGKEVQLLTRLSMGGLWLDPDLTPGQWRPLTDEEVSTLMVAAKFKREDRS